MCLSHVTSQRAAPAAAVRWRRQRCPRTTICHGILAASAYSRGRNASEEREHRASGHLVASAHSRPLCPVELEPEGLSMIKAVCQRKNTGRVHLQFCSVQQLAVASICSSPTAEVQSAGLSETLLLSLSPRSCRTYVPASQLNPRLAHTWASGDAPRASQQSFGNV